MDLLAGGMPGDKAVPDERIEGWMEETPTRSPRCVCQNGMREGKEDGG